MMQAIGKGVSVSLCFQLFYLCMDFHEWGIILKGIEHSSARNKFGENPFTRNVIIAKRDSMRLWGDFTRLCEIWCSEISLV